MIYVVSFVVFLIFFACMALGFIVQGKKLKSEGEANAILEGLTCASCTSACAFAGSGDHNPSSSCKTRAKAAQEPENLVIPHKEIA